MRGRNATPSSLCTRRRIVSSVGISTSMLQRHLVALELAQHDVAVRRQHVVGDEGLLAELGDRDAAPLRQPVLGRDDEGQRVGVDDLGRQPVVAGVVAGDAELEVALEELRRDLARLAAADLDLDLRVAARGSARCAAAGTASTIRWRRWSGARPSRRAARPAPTSAPARGCGSGARTRTRRGPRRSAPAPWRRACRGR